MLPIVENIGFTTKDFFIPLTLPIFGRYDDYGGIVDIVKDDNVELIESFYGCSIEDFCHNVAFYEIPEKVENKIDGLYNVRCMWIDKNVWNFMSNNTKTPRFYSRVGGKYIDEKRFSFVFGVDFEEDKSWNYVDVIAAKPASYFEKLYQDEKPEFASQQVDYFKKLKKCNDRRLIYEYIEMLDVFKDDLTNLYNLISNLSCAALQLEPFTFENRSPQCGEYAEHQLLLEKFAEINKSYICEKDE